MPDIKSTKPDLPITGLLLKDFSDSTYTFDENYVETLFLIWYKKGRLSPKNLHLIVPPDYRGVKPSIKALEKWIYKNDFTL